MRLLTHDGVDELEQALKNRPYALRKVEMVDLNLEDVFLESMKEVDHGR